MRPALKAFLLSALVFPGLGQLYKQDRRKGIVLILLGNLLLASVLLVGVMALSQEYMTSVYPEAITAAKLRVLLLGVLSRPLFYIPAGIFLALWGFAAADAALNASTLCLCLSSLYLYFSSPADQCHSHSASYPQQHQQRGRLGDVDA